MSSNDWEVNHEWEEVPAEDLWEDGELGVEDVKSKIFRRIRLGKYKLMRRKHG